MFVYGLQARQESGSLGNESRGVREAWPGIKPEPLGLESGIFTTEPVGGEGGEVN